MIPSICNYLKQGIKIRCPHPKISKRRTFVQLIVMTFNPFFHSYRNFGYLTIKYVIATLSRFYRWKIRQRLINKYNSKFSLKLAWNTFLVLIYDFLVLCWAQEYQVQSLKIDCHRVCSHTFTKESRTYIRANMTKIYFHLSLLKPMFC